jgi:hypothetical protein
METNQRITAYPYISNLNENDEKILQEILEKNRKKIQDTYLTYHSLQGTIRLEGRNNPLPSIGESIVIDASDITRIKKLGSIHNSTEINRMTDVIDRHKKKVYFRKNGQTFYHSKLWSKLGHCFLEPYSKKYIGILIIDDKKYGEYPIVIVDFEYQWKKETYIKYAENKRRSEEYNVVFKREQKEGIRRIRNYEYQKFIEKIKNEFIEGKKLSRNSIQEVTELSDKRYDTMMIDDKIKTADVRSKIYEIISGHSRKNEKCDHLYLSFDLYKFGFNKYDIRTALKYLEKKNTIYKIVYVDWYVSKKYRDISITDLKNELINENNKILIDIFIAIKNFSSLYRYRRGLKKSDLYDKILKKGYSEHEIYNALRLLEDRDIIYKKSFIYWFTHEYKGDIIIEDTVEEKEDILDKIEKEENILEIGISKIAGDNMENDINDFAKRISDKYKRLMELRSTKKIDERNELINKINRLEQELKDTKVKLENLEIEDREIKGIENYFVQMIDLEKKVEEKNF